MNIAASSLRLPLLSPPAAVFARRRLFTPRFLQGGVTAVSPPVPDPLPAKPPCMRMYVMQQGCRGALGAHMQAWAWLWPCAGVAGGVDRMDCRWCAHGHSPR